MGEETISLSDPDHTRARKARKHICPAKQSSGLTEETQAHVGVLLLLFGPATHRFDVRKPLGTRSDAEGEGLNMERDLLLFLGLLVLFGRGGFLVVLGRSGGRGRGSGGGRSGFEEGLTLFEGVVRGERQGQEFAETTGDLVSQSQLRRPSEHSTTQHADRISTYSLHARAGTRREGRVLLGSQGQSAQLRHGFHELLEQLVLSDVQHISRVHRTVLVHLQSGDTCSMFTNATLRVSRNASS